MEGQRRASVQKGEIAMGHDLVRSTIEGVLDCAVDGTFTPGMALPPEGELAAMFDVSRLTMREAIRVLKDRRVVNVIHGRGTYLVPQEEWIDLESLAYVIRARKSAKELGLELIEMRTILEVGACRVAAAKREESDLVAMEDALRDFDVAHEADDPEGVVAADIAFHKAVVVATKNQFLAAFLTPLGEALSVPRNEVAKVAESREISSNWHRAVYEAIRDQRAEDAVQAMIGHLNQARKDLEALEQ